jgi:serine/threonine-protein kinase
MTQAASGIRARGSLSQVAAAGFIRALHAGRKSGVLHLTRAGVSKRLYFRAGSIILAGSDLPEERLGQALVRAGMIRDADLERALGVVEASGRTIGEAIVEMGLLRPEQIHAEAARRTKLIVESVLDWDSGEYAFEERDERLEGEVLSAMDVPQTLLGWTRGTPSGDVVRRLLGDGKAVMRRAEPLPSTLSGLRLTASEQWALEQANGVSSAEEVAAHAPGGQPEGLRSICGLFLAGILEVGPPQAPGGLTQAFPAPGREPGVGTQLWAALEAERADTGGFGTSGPSFPLPQALGRYVVERAIGRGSMGAVLLAKDPAIDRRVAVKLIQTSVQLTPHEWEKYKERFYREARAAGKLLHQGIVAIFDVGHTVEGIPFIVMEYVEGRTLAALAQDKELPLEEVLRLAVECLEALDYAHAQGVIHRDLKPANIMITADGRPKIMDFGVAHVVGSQMTQADEILGSPHFMAPEQLGKGKVDQRTDLFAFGVVLYWLLTGQLPFTGDSFAVIAQAILSERPVTPKDLRGAVPRALGQIVLRCLEKDPARRFATAGELRSALRAVARPPGAGRLNAITAVVLVLAAIGAFYFFRRPQAGAPASAPPRRASPAAASAPPPARAEPVAQPPAAPTARGEASPQPAPAASPLSSGSSGSAAPGEDSPEQAWKKTLPLTFTAKHSHRIGSCSGSLLLGASAVEFRSSAHERWRFRLGDVRVLEREDTRKLRVETKDGKSYNFSLTSRPLGDQDWARYRKLAGK